jgi:hypothetical protein
VKRLALVLPLIFLVACASFGHWTPETKSVVDGLWDAAKMLCLLANAEKAGTTVDDVAEKCCKTREEIAPWFEAAKAGARAGAVKAGMSEPLTPANAEPQSVRERQEENRRAIRAVPELEQRK